MTNRKFQSVLYVDDDPDICEVVRSTLSLIAGLKVDTVASGEQAIDVAYELRPDLILMDVMMPGLDGPSTFKRMRASPLISDIPVIFLTAKVLPTEVAHFLQLGAIGVISKPFDPLKLCDEVFALWRSADTARAIASAQSGSAQSAQPEIQAQLDTLTNSFLQRTRSDAVRLRELIERVRQGERSMLKEIERVTHSIHGAGAMFGFPEVSRSGEAIERLVEEAMAGFTAATPGEPAMLRRLSDLTAQLSRDIEAAAQALPSSGMLQARDMGKNDKIVVATCAADT
jgi:two-component system OmpR family response regulator